MDGIDRWMDGWIIPYHLYELNVNFCFCRRFVFRSVWKWTTSDRTTAMDDKFSCPSSSFISLKMSDDEVTIKTTKDVHTNKWWDGRVCMNASNGPACIWWLADYGYRANKYPRHKFLAVGFMGCLPYQRLRRLSELKAIAGVSSHKHPYVQHSIYSYIYIVGKVCLYVRGYIWQRQATGAGAQPNRASTYCRLSILAWPVWRDHR